MKTTRAALVVVGSMALFSVVLSQQANSRAQLSRRSAEVATDATDYPPGGTAYIIGRGFLPKETVSLQVLHADGTASTGSDHDPWAVQADPRGEFATSWHVCEDDCVGSVLGLTAVGLRSGRNAQTQFTDSPLSNGQLEGWFNLAMQWGGTIQGVNSKYTEGATIPLRFTATLPSGTSHMVLLKFDFSNGGDQRFFDSLGSYDATVKNVNPTAGFSGLGPAQQKSILPDATLRPGAQIPGYLTTYNIATVRFGDYTLVNGVKMIPVTFTVAGGGGNKNVIIAYGGHLASSSIWGPFNGASQFPGASTKAFASLDGASDANVSVNPAAVVGTADLSILKTASPVISGSLLTYQITVSNNGPEPASSVIVTDPLPAGTTLVSAVPSQGTFSGTTTLSFALGTINAGDTATMTLVVNLGGSSTITITNTASVASATIDPDTANNTSSATSTRDVTPPVIHCPSGSVVATAPGTCSAVVSFGVTATDDLPGVTVLCEPPSGSTFPKGTNTVMCTATDASNNSASCSFKVTVIDTEPPLIRCPPDIVVGTDPGRCEATVSFPIPNVTDNCPGPIAVACNPGSGSLFPIGDTVVSCAATDAVGNVSRCAFKVSVQDPVNVFWPQARPLTLAENAEILQATDDECITALDQSRWFRFRVQPGSRVIVTLTALPADYDLVLFKDIGLAFARLTSQQDLVRLNAEFANDAFSPAAFSPDAFSPAAFSPAAFSPAAFSPAAFSPAAFSPAAFSPAAFSPAAFSPDTFAPAAFSPAEINPAAFSPAAFSAAQIQSVIAVSAFDGNAGEGIIANTWDESGDFYVRVRGRNGVFSPGAPFHLEVFMIPGECGNVSPVALDALNHPLPPSTVGAAPGGYKTIILADLDRMLGSSPSQDKTNLLGKLGIFAARPEVKGVVVDVSADPWVSFFNQQADANFDCPFAKNLVAGAIKGIVDRSRPGNALEYIVIVGNDRVIPFFRYPDEAMLGPEQNYFPPVRDFTASQASLRLNYVLGQDAYGAECDVSLKSTTIPVPGLAVGRLVETASDVTAMLDAYLETRDGVVPKPTSALVTGYDFLQDAADAVRAELEAGLATRADALILDHTLPPTSPLAWTADDLRGQFLGKRHDLIFLAGHFSANAALAADYTTRLFSSELANATLDLKNAILFSAGCHSGYNTVDADGIPFVTLQPDWAQACASKRVTFVGGTSYQYGDTDFIEYSEKLYLEFSKQLRAGTDAVPVGKALARAKEIYLATTPQMRGIHQKAFLEATLFGLPMLSVNMPGARLAANPDQSIVGATQTFGTEPGRSLGLAFADITVSPSLTSHQVVLTNPDDSSTATATYLSGGAGIINNPAEPILPLEVRNVTVSGTVLRGVGFRGSSYTDLPNILPLTGAPTTEIRGVHTAFPSEFFYPTKPWQVNYFDALCNSISGATRLLVIPAQFMAGSSGAAKGTLREYQTMNFRLFYSGNLSAPALSAAPSISGVSGITQGDQALFSAYVTGNPAAGVQQVWVTYSALSGPYAGRWQSLDLTNDSVDPTLWEGTLPLNGTVAGDVRYLVQAVNGVGLVALDSKSSAYHRLDEVESRIGAATAVILLTPPTSGAYGTSVSCRARLTSNGLPLAGIGLRFSLGGQEASADTDANGVASGRLNVLTLPGQYPLQVAFRGGSGYAASFATSPFTITKQATSITLAPATTVIRPGLDSKIVATLFDAAGGRLVERTVIIVVMGTGGSYALPSITDFLGRAPLGPVSLPSGNYTVSAYFAGTVPLPPPNLPVSMIDDSYEQSSASVSLVIDSQAPVITSLSANPSVLRPPNHQMVLVTVNVTASDSSGPATCKITAVTSNESVNGLGDGDQEPDWAIAGDLSVYLRAERAQNGPGRTYTITVTCTDLAGNSTNGTATVFAPK